MPVIWLHSKKSHGASDLFEELCKDPKDAAKILILIGKYPLIINLWLKTNLNLKKKEARQPK